MQLLGTGPADRRQALGSDIQIAVCAFSRATWIAFLGAAVVFPHFGSKGTKGLFSSWTGSYVIFRNKFQQNHAMLMKRERKVTLPWLLGQDPVAPRPQVLLELSGLRRKLPGLRLRKLHFIRQKGCHGQRTSPQGPSKRGSKITLLCDPDSNQRPTHWTSRLANTPSPPPTP